MPVSTVKLCLFDHMLSLVQDPFPWFCINHAISYLYMIYCVQAVPLSARKAGGGSTEGIASFLQLPHFSEAVTKKIARKVCGHTNKFNMI